jgi:hypothetical protein
MLAHVRPTRARALGEATLSRRSLLAVAVVGTLTAAGCTPSTDPAPPTDAPRDDDAVLAAAVVAQEEGLIALYDATVAAFPALGSALTSIRDQHAAHRDALSPQGSPTASPSPPIAAGTSQAAAIAGLLEAERRAVSERTESCVAARIPDTARLLALIAASEASHVEFLRREA